MKPSVVTDPWRNYRLGAVSSLVVPFIKVLGKVAPVLFSSSRSVIVWGEGGGDPGGASANYSIPSEWSQYSSDVRNNGPPVS